MNANTSQSRIGSSSGWSTWSCSGVRKAGVSDDDIGAFQVGDSVLYAAGFRYSSGAQASSPVTGGFYSSEDLVYTLVEKVEPGSSNLSENFALALALSTASVSAIAALVF